VENFRKDGFEKSEVTVDRRELCKTPELVTDFRRKRSRWLGNMFVADQEQEVKSFFLKQG
jgi:hypothetical protein